MPQDPIIAHLISKDKFGVLLDKEEGGGGGSMPKLSSASCSSSMPSHHHIPSPVKTSANNTNNNNSEVQQQQQQVSVVKCPRCDSSNTKFCYYNNYSLTQPRHFCKNCRRYWTQGGSLRNVPVGGGCRKNKRIKQRTTTTTTIANVLDPMGAGHLFSVPGLADNISHHNHHSLLMDGMNPGPGTSMPLLFGGASGGHLLLPPVGIGPFGPPQVSFPLGRHHDHDHHLHHNHNNNNNNNNNINLVNNNVLMPPQAQATFPSNESQQLLSMAFARLQESLRLGGGSGDNVRADSSSSSLLYNNPSPSNKNPNNASTSSTPTTATNTTTSAKFEAIPGHVFAAGSERGMASSIFDHPSNASSLSGGFHQLSVPPGSATATLASLQDQISSFTNNHHHKIHQISGNAANLSKIHQISGNAANLSSNNFINQLDHHHHHHHHHHLDLDLDHAHGHDHDEQPQQTKLQHSTSMMNHHFNSESQAAACQSYVATTSRLHNIMNSSNNHGMNHGSGNGGDGGGDGDGDGDGAEIGMNHQVHQNQGSFWSHAPWNNITSNTTTSGSANDHHHLLHSSLTSS